MDLDRVQTVLNKRSLFINVIEQFSGAGRVPAQVAGSSGSSGWIWLHFCWTTTRRDVIFFGAAVCMFKCVQAQSRGRSNCNVYIHRISALFLPVTVCVLVSNEPVFPNLFFLCDVPPLLLPILYANSQPSQVFYSAGLRPTPTLEDQWISGPAPKPRWDCPRAESCPPYCTGNILTQHHLQPTSNQPSKTTWPPSSWEDDRKTCLLVRLNKAGAGCQCRWLWQKNTNNNNKRKTKQCWVDQHKKKAEPVSTFDVQHKGSYKPSLFQQTLWWCNTKHCKSKWAFSIRKSDFYIILPTWTKLLLPVCNILSLLYLLTWCDFVLFNTVGQNSCFIWLLNFSFSLSSFYFNLLCIYFVFSHCFCVLNKVI